MLRRYNAGADCIQDIEICLSTCSTNGIEDSCGCASAVVPADENKPRAGAKR